MKALLITAIPCEPVRKLRPEAYIGYKLGDCGHIEHIIITKGKIARATRKCENCVLGQLVRRGHLMAPPTIVQGGNLRFIVSDTRESRKVIEMFRDQVIWIEEADLRSIALTPRQRQVVRLLASDENISGVARELGISKTAAWKLVKKSIKKIARIHAG